MSRADSWTAEWTADKVNGHNEVLEVNQISRNAIQIKTKRSTGSLLIATLSADYVRRDDLVDVYTNNSIVFVMNVPRDAVFDGPAISFSDFKSFGLGGLGDLYVAINENSFRHYRSKETRFILRGLGQHTRVSDINRITNRLYEIHRHGLEPIRVLALNEYDLTADAVRTGIDKHGKCSIILTSNPNCRPSEEAVRAAVSAGARVLGWGELLSALHNAE